MDFIRIALDITKSKAGEELTTEELDKRIEKYSEKNFLSKGESQRLVEEVNIMLFGKKLSKGKQREDFPLATPISPETDISGKVGNGEMLKVSSYNGLEISGEMFVLGGDSISSGYQTPMGMSGDDSIYMSKEAMYGDRSEELELKKEASLKLKREEAMDAVITRLADKFSRDYDLIKSAVAFGVNHVPEMSDLILMNTKISHSDIANLPMDKSSIYKVASMVKTAMDNSKVSDDDIKVKGKKGGLKQALLLGGVGAVGLGAGFAGGFIVNKSLESGRNQKTALLLDNPYERNSDE